MALLYMTGFDQFNSIADMNDDGWYTSNDSYWTIDTTTFRFGRAALRGTGYGSDRYAYLTLPKISSGTTFIIGFAVRLNADPGENNRNFFLIGRKSNWHVSVRWDLDRTLEVRENQGGTIIANGTTQLRTNNWHYMELKVVIAASGSVELRLDGNVEASASGVDTYNSSAGSADVDQIVLCSCFSTSTYVRFDDLYCCDGSGSYNNDFLGPIRVDTLMPQGPGNYSQLDVSGEVGLNYKMVDEFIPDDSNLVETVTEDEIDTYDFHNLPTELGSGGAIHAVMMTARHIRKDTNLVHGACFARIDSNDYSGEHFTMLTHEQTGRYIMEVNPDDSAAWEKEDVNSGEFGVKFIGES